MRQRKEKPIEVDLALPVDKEAAKAVYPEGDCFGLEWNARDKECSGCADFELCGIIYMDQVKKKEKDLAGDRVFLDQANFDTINEEELLAQVVDGKTTSGELLAIVSKMARCEDMMAVKNWTIRFIKQRQKIRTEKGVVWFRH